MKIAVVGASGYAGAELVEILCQHSKVSDLQLLVSENSESSGLLFSDLYPRMQNVCDIALQPFSQSWLNANKDLDARYQAIMNCYDAYTTGSSSFMCSQTIDNRQWFFRGFFRIFQMKNKYF